MKSVINIKSNKASKEVEHFKHNVYPCLDIKFENVHLKRINELARKKIFLKNDVYITASTLHELMQEVGTKGTHNYHGLSSKDIIDALNNLSIPNYVFKSHSGRYVVIPSVLSSFDLPLLIVIEKDASLTADPFAKINKIVTIYPKDKLETYIKKMTNENIIFIKK